MMDDQFLFSKSNCLNYMDRESELDYKLFLREIRTKMLHQKLSVLLNKQGAKCWACSSFPLCFCL